MYWFTADEHYGHPRIREYCGRPFCSVSEMDEEIIRRYNEVVGDDDTVIHAGDFTLRPSLKESQKYISQLKGKHIFLRGSHDKWTKKLNCHEIFELTIDGQYIVVCHYAMRVWPRSHYNSWQLFGHSHGRLEPIGKQMDVGIYCHRFYPVSFEQVKTYMFSRPDNPNLIRKR